MDYLFKFVENFYWIKIKKIAIDSYNEDIRVYEIYKDNKLFLEIEKGLELGLILWEAKLLWKKIEKQ